MADKKKLNITVRFLDPRFNPKDPEAKLHGYIGLPSFELFIDGPGIDPLWKSICLTLDLWFTIPKEKEEKRPEPWEDDIVCNFYLPASLSKEDHKKQLDNLISSIGPLASPFESYSVTKKEREDFQKVFDPLNPYKANIFIGELAKRLLGGAGYIVNVEFPDYYFPSPTSMGSVAPVFSMGLQKEVEPIDVKTGYETTYTYLSREKPLHKTQIQLSVFDAIPEQRLKEISYQLKTNLSPYGLKCLYLVIEECGRKRVPWFLLDTNRCLDLLGHKRNKKNVHQPKSKTRLLKELEELTRIKFNIERRSPLKGNKEKAFRIQRPLLSVGEFEEKEVETGQPFEDGKTIRDGVEIFIHPQIYADINDWYTHIPHAYLTIDARSNPHAILLYPYIANQWRVGLRLYNGTISQTLRQILDGAGLLGGLPKRKNQQRDFIDRVKDNLLWLREQPDYWIKDVTFRSKNRPLLEQTVIIEMAEEHPLRTAMKQIGKKNKKV